MLATVSLTAIYPSASGLRAALWGLNTSGDCEWPECEVRATQLAHLHSTGMGGRTSAHTLDNAMAACDFHALITDGGVGDDWAEHIILLQVLYTPAEAEAEYATAKAMGSMAWCRAEWLKEALLESREWAA